MDPISIGVEIEIGALLIACVGAVATWIHHRHARADRAQRERHHQEARKSLPRSRRGDEKATAPRDGHGRFVAADIARANEEDS